MARVLLIGLDPALVDFSQSARGATQVKAAGATAIETLRTLGHHAEDCLVDLGATAESVVTEALARNTFDCILIGAGIRALPQHTKLFEQIINVVHRRASTAMLCFNTNPNDTAEAVLRALAPLNAG